MSPEGSEMQKDEPSTSVTEPPPSDALACETHGCGIARQRTAVFAPRPRI
jgi:hypothetical protein